MNLNNKAAKIVGTLFLIVFITNIIGSGFIEDIIYDPDYLSTAYLFKTSWITGLILQFISFAGTVSISIMMFPFIKRYSMNLAFGYLAFRTIEALIFTFTEINSLSLLTLSKEYVSAAASDTSYFQTLGALLQEGRSWSFNIGMFFFCIGALVFYYALFQSKLLPKFISIWGLAGAVMAMAATILKLFGLEYSVLGIVLHLPIGLNELFLSVWLIVRGFKADIGQALTSNQSYSLE